MEYKCLYCNRLLRAFDWECFGLHGCGAKYKHRLGDYYSKVCICDTWNKKRECLLNYGKLCNSINPENPNTDSSDNLIDSSYDDYYNVWGGNP